MADEQPVGAVGSSAALVAELRRLALAERLASDGDGDGDGDGAGELQRVARALCAEARGRGMRCEELVVYLKQAWQQLPDSRPLPSNADAHARNRAVSVCIEEYYKS